MGFPKRISPMEEGSDRKLAKRMLAGDNAAFEAFFEESFPPLYRFSLSRVRDGELAREIAQTAICNAISNLRKYRGDAPLSAWLFTICRNEINAHFRRLRRNPAQVELIEETPEVRLALDGLAAGMDGPEEALQRKETVRHIHGLLDRLPARYSQTLEWKYIDGLSVKDIAERLGLGPKAAESLLTRARVAFKEGYSTLVKRQHSVPTLKLTHWSAALLSLA